MRTPNRNTGLYTPGQVPEDAAEMPRFLFEQLQSISAALALVRGHLDETHVAPAKPRTGDVVLADGTNWDPGSGQGYYGYYGSAWHKLG